MRNSCFKKMPPVIIRLALDISSRVAEKEVTRIQDPIGRDDLPVVLKTAFNALLTGIYQKQSE